jgi:hypothetical protein
MWKPCYRNKRQAIEVWRERESNGELLLTLAPSMMALSCSNDRCCSFL